MGALTLGLVVPVTTSVQGESSAQAAPSTCLDAQLRTVADIREAARELGYEVELVALPEAASAEMATSIMRRRLGHADRVLVIGHGEAVGHGKIHALARSCGLPVLGPDGLAVALSDDKLLSRRALANHNIAVPRSVSLREPDAQSLGRLGWPRVLKPRSGGFGQGVERLSSSEQLDDALERAAESDTELLLERELVGREVSVVVLDGQVLGTAELERRFTDAGVETTQMSCPAPLDTISLAGVENMALRSCAALGLGRGPTRVDIIMSERHNEVVLEVEALPPLHRDSVVARVARAAGHSYSQLLTKLLGPAPRPRVRRSASVAAQLHA